MVGKEEYNRQFCESKITDLKPNENAALFEDQVKKIFPPSVERIWGCCRVPKGVNGISKSRNCIHTKDYKPPNLKTKIAFFLKKFK